MATRGVDEVRQHLRGLAERGVLRRYYESKNDGGAITFTFEWLFDKPFTLLANEDSGTIEFKNLLPDLPIESSEFAAVKEFIETRSDPTLRPHRRVDPARATMGCETEDGQISINLVVKNGEFDYGIRTLMNLTNELFGQMQLYCADYLTMAFDLPEE